MQMQNGSPPLVFASQGYDSGVPGSFGIYEQSGEFWAEQHTGRPEMPATFHKLDVEHITLH